jgi:hypothetical protein
VRDFDFRICIFVFLVSWCPPELLRLIHYLLRHSTPLATPLPTHHSQLITRVGDRWEIGSGLVKLDCTCTFTRSRRCFPSRIRIHPTFVFESLAREQELRRPDVEEEGHVGGGEAHGNPRHLSRGEGAFQSERNRSLGFQTTCGVANCERCGEVIGDVLRIF